MRPDRAVPGPGRGGAGQDPADDDCYGRTRAPAPGRIRSSGANLGKEDGYRALSYLLAGMLLYGFVGWLLDSWLDTTFWLPIGVVVGAACSIYLIIRRYGSGHTATIHTAATPTQTEPTQTAPATPVASEPNGKEGTTSWQDRA